MEKTNTEYINQIAYDMIYLASFGINSKGKPDEKCLERYRTNEENRKELFRMSAKHFIDALVGTTLKRAGVVLPKYWEERMVKAVRKVLLFDVERKKLCAWMDRERIWYLPLKGIILKEYYPSIGMRQMSDNDILFDADAWERVEKHMLSEGYETESVGNGNHDVYQKAPVYNFEMHRSLYGKGHDERWVEYYSDIKDCLIPDRADDRCYGYHMSDEDFYIYITSHAYKHYSGSGTGLRTLLDFYAYLNAKEDSLDFDYIRTACKKLGIDDFEQHNCIYYAGKYLHHNRHIIRIPLNSRYRQMNWRCFNTIFHPACTEPLNAWSQTAWRSRQKQTERRICQSLIIIGIEYFREWSCMRIIRYW